jgi:hypothetical protein
MTAHKKTKSRTLMRCIHRWIAEGLWVFAMLTGDENVFTGGSDRPGPWAFASGGMAGMLEDGVLDSAIAPLPEISDAA